MVRVRVRVMVRVRIRVRFRVMIKVRVSILDQILFCIHPLGLKNLYQTERNKPE